MNNCPLDQKYLDGSNKAANTTTKVQRITHPAISEGSILERVWDFAFSISDFRRTDRGNIRQVLGDIIILMIFARMSQCGRRADMIKPPRENSFYRKGHPKTLVYREYALGA